MKKMTENGISTTLNPGNAKHEIFRSLTKGTDLCQYDYRHFDGQLFSCVLPTLQDCQKACKYWKRKQPKTEIPYLTFTLINSWNSDGWVLYNHHSMMHGHLGNFKTLDNVKKSALFHFMLRWRVDFMHIVHNMAMYGCGIYHEWSTFEKVCNRECVEIPKEIHCSEDTNRSISYKNEVFTNTKKR